MDLLRVCMACHKSFPSTDAFFSKGWFKGKNNPMGLNGRCYPCMYEYRRIYREKKKAEPGYPHKTRRPSTPRTDAHRQRLRENNRMVKLQALQAYSDPIPFCQCCGETFFEFLTIDHIYGGGGAHRREIGRTNIYSWLRQQAYPPGFRVLCLNCNFSIGKFGYCPHQQPGIDVAKIRPRYRKTKYWQLDIELPKTTEE